MVIKLIRMIIRPWIFDISPIEIFPALELIVRPVFAISIVPVEKLIVEEAPVVVKLGSAPVKSINFPLLDSTVTLPAML